MHAARLASLLLLILVFPTACATRGSSSGIRHHSAERSNAPAVRNAADILTAREIATLPHLASTREAVRLLRPRFLEPHGSPSAADMRGYAATVYLDGQRVGGAEALETIPLTSVVEIRYLTPSTASQWFAPGHPGGAILVRTR